MSKRRAKRSAGLNAQPTSKSATIDGTGTSRATRKRNQENLKIDETRCYINRIPQDVLYEIFLACLPTDRNPCMSAVESPVLLTRVCLSWRRFAYSIPRLWAAILIVLPPFQHNKSRFSATIPDERSVGKRLALLEHAVDEWINRSGSIPLSFSIYQSKRASIPSESGLWNRMMSMYTKFLLITLHPHITRWLNVDVCMHPRLLAAFMEGLTNDSSMPMFKYIHIECHEHMFRDTQPDRPIDILMRLLSDGVKSVSFTGCEFQQPADDLRRLQHAPWKQITELCLEGKRPSAPHQVTSIDIMLSVVRHCVLLETLKISAHTFPGVPVIEYETDLTLSKLTSLSIIMDSSWYTAKALASLRLPSLKFFDCSIEGHHPYPGNFKVDAQMFCYMLNRLLCHVISLETFGIYSVYFNSHTDLLDILRMTPHLQCLSFSWGRMPFYRWGTSTGSHATSQKQISVLNDDFLDALSAQGKDPLDIICPRLKSFDCYDAIQTSFTKKAVKRFIQSRTDSTIQVPQVSVMRNARIAVISRSQPKSLADYGFWSSHIETRRFLSQEGLRCWRDTARPYRFLGYDII